MVGKSYRRNGFLPRAILGTRYCPITTDLELRYDPGSFVLRVGENRFTAAISDASGINLRRV